MNPNDLDPNGEELETPDGSQPETITADEGGQDNPQGAEQPSPEEVAFNSLKGSTQDRVRSLAQKANQAAGLEAEAERLRAENEALRLKGMVPQPGDNPDIKEAVSKLDGFGVATKDFVNQTIKDEVNKSLSGIAWNMEMDRLENRHNGKDGLPSFDRSEYEAFVNANPTYRNYQPEDVYTKMYEDELFDARVKGLGTQPERKSPNLRPTRTRVQEETMTPDYIEARLQKPDGRAWYEQNRDRINAVIATQPSSE